MSNVTTVGIDLAKKLFSVHGVDALGRVVLRRTVRREQLAQLIAQLPVCLIGMEACSGAHEWARGFAAHGHTVRLMAPKFVAPYRKSGKNDGNDAEAICEAVARPNMRFVPVKSVAQQATLTLHRVRQGFIEERIATINRIRGLLAEFGHVLPQRSIEVRRGVPELLEQLPALVAGAVRDLLAHLRLLDARVLEYERQIGALARHSELAQRAQQLAGVGPISASAILATMGEAHEFRNARQFAEAARHRRQGASRAHHARRGCVPANAPGDGCARRAAARPAARGPDLALGGGAARALRLPQSVRGDCRQECTHPLGAAGPRGGAARGVTGTT